MNRITALVIAFLLSLHSHAATVESSRGGFDFDFGVGNFVSENLIIHSYYEGFDLRTTFSYRLADNSAFNAQALDGWMHIDVAQNYDLTEDEHEFRVGFSDVNPQDVIGNAFFNTAFGGDLPEYFSWFIATDGLLAATGENHRGEFPNEQFSGNLWFEQGSPDNYFGDSGVFICVECGFDLTLNFLFMDFSGGTLSLNLLDDRLGVLLANDYYGGNEPYGFDLNLTARPVPVPAAGLLLVSALMLLARRTRA